MKLYTISYLSAQGGFNRTKYIVASDFDSAYQAFKKLNLGVIIGMNTSLDHDEELVIAR